MAVSTTDTYSGPYVANGVTVEFPFTFKAVAPADVGVFIRDAGGVDTLVEDAAYNVTLAAQGGTVVMVTAPAAGDVYIFSEPSFLQPVSFASGQPFLPSVVNEVNDRDVARALWLRDQVERAPRIPIGGGSARGQFPRVNLDGTWGWSVGSGVGGAGTNAEWSLLATADGQTSFNFSQMPQSLWEQVLASPAAPRFLINGIPLDLDEGYTWSPPFLSIDDENMHVDDVVTLRTAISFDQGVVDARNALFSASSGINSTVGAELKRWVWIEMYGGKADYDPASHTYQTDNLGALNRAIAALGGKGGTVLFGNGHFGFSGDIVLPDNVTLEGRCRNVGNQNPSLVLMAGAMLWIPGGGKGVVLANSCALRQLGVFRQGLTFFQGSATFSQWTGWGVTQKASTTDHLLEDIFIAGFEHASRPETITVNYDGSPGSVTYSRFNTKGKVSIDCINGIWLHNCSDLPVIGTVHCWPFTTVFSPAEPNSAQLKRPGWAIYLSGLNDHTMVDKAFNYGYRNSFHVDGGDNTTWMCCDADYPYQSAIDGSFGYQSSGGSQETRWVACQAVQRDSGFITNSTEANLLSTEAIGCQAWECRTNGHAVTKGHAKINGGTTRSSYPGSIGIQTSSDPTAVCDYAMHHFANLALATVNGLSSIPLRDCGGNTYSNMNSPRHQNRYQPGIASAGTIALNGTDEYYVITGGTAISNINSPGDYIGKVITCLILNGLTIRVSGNISTKTGADTAIAAGLSVQFIATSAGWRQL